MELNYKKAIDTEDLQLLPPRFGPKTMVPNAVKLQMVIVEENDATPSSNITSLQTKPSPLTSIHRMWLKDRQVILHTDGAKACKLALTPECCAQEEVARGQW